MQGLVIKSTGSWYQVYAEDGNTYDCRIKGKFRIQGIQTTNPIAVGDKVEFELEPNAETGVIDKLQDRGKFFVEPNAEIYEGQVIGENSRSDDMCINVTKEKKLSNVRSSGNDDKARIIPPIIFSLEEALEYIQKDEYVEVTPKSIRLRKIYLTETDRKRFKI